MNNQEGVVFNHHTKGLHSPNSFTDDSIQAYRVNRIGCIKFLAVNQTNDKKSQKMWQK